MNVCVDCGRAGGGYAVTSVLEMPSSHVMEVGSEIVVVVNGPSSPYAMDVQATS